MEKRSGCTPQPGVTPPSTQVFFDLPGGKQLFLERDLRTVLVLSRKEGETSYLFSTFLLPPTAAPIFLALLQAYPLHCTYRELFRTLYPQTTLLDEHEWDREKKLALPLIRRALKALLPALRGCGLQAVSLRGQGYLLVPRPSSQKQP